MVSFRHKSLPVGPKNGHFSGSKHSWDVKTIQQTGYLNNHPTVYSLNISAVKLCIYNSIKINIGFQFTVAAISKHF